MNRTQARVHVSGPGKAEIRRRVYRARYVLGFQSDYPKSFCFEIAVPEIVFAFLDGLASVGNIGRGASALLLDSDDHGPDTVWMCRLAGYDEL